MSAVRASAAGRRYLVLAALVFMFLVDQLGKDPAHLKYPRGMGERLVVTDEMSPTAMEAAANVALGHIVQSTFYDMSLNPLFWRVLIPPSDCR